MRGSATSFLRYRQKKFYSKHKLPSFHIKTILIRTYIWPLTLLVCRAKDKGGLNTFSSTSTSIMHMTICCFGSWLAYTNKSLQISSLGAFCFIIFSVLFFMLLVIKDFPPNFQILWSSKTWIQTCKNMISTVRWTCPKAWIQTTDRDNVFRAWQELPCAATCKATSKWIMVAIIIISPCLSTFYLPDRFFRFLGGKKSFSFIVSLTNLFS